MEKALPLAHFEYAAPTSYSYAHPLLALILLTFS
jgi:hypothetical protein